MANEIIVRHEFDQASIEKLSQASDVLKKSLGGGGGSNPELEKTVKSLQEQVSLLKKALKLKQQDSDATESIYQRMTRLRKAYKEATDPADAKRLKLEFEKVRGEVRKFEQLGKTTSNTWTKALGSFQFKFNALGNIAANVTSNISRQLKNTLKIVKDFDGAVANLAAITGKTKEEIGDLTNEAIRLGSVTKFTATNVVELQTELAKLGFTTDEISVSTKAVLDFAAATNAELGPAAKVAGIAVRAFGLNALEAEDAVATLAIATTKSALQFSDFETVLSKVGPVARAYGLTIEDTTALLGKLKDAGFDASTAATATRNIFLNLANTNGALAKSLGGPVKTFDELIPALITLRDNGVSLNETLELTDKRSVAAFNQFLQTAEGALELRDSITGVNEELKEMVDTQLDSLPGKILLVKSAWEGLVLTIDQGTGPIGKSVGAILDSVATALTSLTNADIAATIAIKGAKGLTEEQMTRWFDMLQSGTTLTEEYFQATIRAFDELEYADVFGNEEKFKETIKDIGFTKKEAERLWDEYIDRRQQQNEKELKISTESAERELKRIEQNEAERKDIEAEYADKRKKELEKLDNEAFAKYTQIEKAKIEITENAVERAIRAEQLKHTTILREAKDNNELLELEAIRHAQAMAGIAEEYYLKPLERTVEKVNETQLKASALQTEETIDDAEKRLSVWEKLGEQTIEADWKAWEARVSIASQSLGLISALQQAQLNSELQRIDKLTISEEEKEKRKEEIRRKYARKQQTISIAEALIGTAQAVINALQTKPFLPLGLIMAALAGGLGAAQVAVIASQKFAKGGWVEGPGHDRGGVPIEAEGGEYIIRKERARQFDSILESINNDPAHTVWNKLNIELNKKNFKSPSIILNNKRTEQLLERIAEATESSPRDMGKYITFKHNGITYKVRK